ncbi:hypothetical protein TeGR_g8724 [Tetraparma gracilis]|uniref:Uncharacterized protein n=1 Tax=Tetraparma gracilis TaxID=2962635 RepID=A0ABQ6N837_9STRA|nr:hypothetical protein TeGR_g8724 [Tetraparma gracilis]
MECVILLTSIRRSLFATDADRTAFLSSLMTGITGLMSTSKGLEHADNYHQFCRLLGRLKANYQLSELIKALVAAVPYVRPDTGPDGHTQKLEASVNMVIKCYIQSMLASVPLIVSEGVDDPLDDEGSLRDQLERLPVICRFQYPAMAQFLIQQMDEIMGTYQTTIATLSTYNITPAQQEALAVTEGQLTWLVYIIGAVVGGHSWSSTHLDDGEEIIDASLSRRVFQLVQLVDFRCCQSQGQMKSDSKLEQAFLFYFQNFRRVYMFMEEGKEAEGKTDDRSDEEDDDRRGEDSSSTTQLIDALIEWGVSPSFESALSTWMNDRCMDFIEERPEIQDEQPLSWGTAFAEYSEWLDEQLGDFCDEDGSTPEEVGRQMQSVMQTLSGSFFPAFMEITEYDIFVTQMHNLAEAKVIEEEAAKAADGDGLVEGKAGEFMSGDVMNISGVWEADPNAYDPARTEAMLIHGECPWMNRKILKRASKLVKDVRLTQTEDDFTIIFTLHLFGTKLKTYKYDVWTDDLNLWNKPFKKKVLRPGKDGLKYVQTDHPNLPEGTKDTSHFWLEDGGDRLMWESRMYRPDLDKEVVNVQQFMRRGSSLATSSRRK